MENEYQTMIIDGQMMIIPTMEQWELIFENPEIEGKSIAVIDLIKQKVIKNSQYEEIKSCFGFYKDTIIFYELLKLNDSWLRVHLESVVCEVCKKRPEISATPGVIDAYIGLEDKFQVMKKGFRYPNQKCKWCNTLYERRYTIWQKYKD